MTINWTAIGHLVIAAMILGAACAMGAIGLLTGSQVFAIIVGVGVGAGVLAGVTLSPTTTTLRNLMQQMQDVPPASCTQLSAAQDEQGVA